MSLDENEGNESSIPHQRQLLSGMGPQNMHCGVQENHDTCEQRPLPEPSVRSSIHHGPKVDII